MCLFQAEKEPILSSFLYASILSHHCLEQALSFVLANRLANPTLLATQLLDIFYDVIMHDEDIQRAIRLDIQVYIFLSFHIVLEYTYSNTYDILMACIFDLKCIICFGRHLKIVILLVCHTPLPYYT